MVKHTILWKLKEDIDNKEETAALIKTQLESLNGRIDGLISLTVHTVSLPSSTADLMLESCFENEEALKNYAKNPLHVDIANTYVRCNVSLRLAFDSVVE